MHEIAGQVAPGTRVLYADNDPIVHVHANALLANTGTTSIVLADLRDPQAILTHPNTTALIDFTQPVAVLLIAVVHFVLTDADDPARIIATLRDVLPAGSYLALSHGTADFHPPGTASRAAATYESSSPAGPPQPRQVARFFDGFNLVEPGLVQAPLWRPDGRPPRAKDLAKIGMYAGVGIKKS